MSQINQRKEYVTDEQVKLARSVDLLTYLQTTEPYELRRSGPNEYRTVSHGSLVLSKGLWIWNRGRVGGRSALDFLIKVRGMSFVEAVQSICESRAAHDYSGRGRDPPTHINSPPDQNAKTSPQKQLILPKPVRFATHALNYLQKRGISAEVINRCIQSGILYEGRHNGANVCVFVGRDESEKERFACMRGIDTDLKQDCSGSDKRYSFRLVSNNSKSKHLAVFESAIDLLSHATLQQRKGWDWDGHRLALDGLSSIALISFLEQNPQIMRVILHLDNDVAGLTAARKIKAELASDKRFSNIRVSVNPARHGKDYNMTLLHEIKEEREQKQTGIRRDIGLSM